MSERPICTPCFAGKHGECWGRDCGCTASLSCRGAASRSEQAADTWTCGRCALVFMSADAFTKHQLAGHPAAEAAQSPQVGAAPVVLICGHTASLTWCMKEPGHLGAHSYETMQPAAGPPVNPPVASADPELAKLLRDLRMWIEVGPSVPTRQHKAVLLGRIDSALSRLAGQSATKEVHAIDCEIGMEARNGCTCGANPSKSP